MMLTMVPGKGVWQSLRYVSDGVMELERLANMGATCTNCGSTNTKKVQVEKNGKVVRTYFTCNDCGWVW